MEDDLLALPEKKSGAAYYVGRYLVVTQLHAVSENDRAWLLATSRQNFIALFVHSTCTVQYVPKILCTQATIDSLATNKTMNRF